MYQQTIIIGHLGNDPELRYTQAGIAVCGFTVATSEKWKNATGERQERTTWFRVSAWRALAEVCNQYAKKGDKIMITGTIAASAYTSNAGQPAANLELTAHEVKFLGGNNGQSSAPAPEREDDIPF